MRGEFCRGRVLRSQCNAVTVRALAGQAGVAYSNVDREVLRMRELDLLRTEVVGKALLCTWNSQNPVTQKLTDLLDASSPRGALRPPADAIYGSLKSRGAGLAKDVLSVESLPLEETLAYGVEHARLDPDVA